MIPLLLALATQAGPLDPCRGTRILVSTYGDGVQTQVGLGSRRLVHSDKGSTVQIKAEASGIRGAPIPVGAELTWELLDGTRVTLPNTREARPTARAIGAVAVDDSKTSWTPQLLLSPEAIHALAGSPAQALRFEVDGQAVVTEVSRKEARAMQIDFACLTNQLGR